MTEKMPPSVPSGGSEDTPQQQPGQWGDAEGFTSVTRRVGDTTVVEFHPPDDATRNDHPELPLPDDES